MAARAIFTATLAIDDIELPIKLYAAVDERRVAFHLLSPRTGERIRQRMVDPELGEEVESEQVRSGFEVEPGRFVTFAPEELDQLRPEASRRIEITRFVDRSEIDHRWYLRPYYLGPGEGREDDYFALAAALAKRGQEGIARWVMRSKAYAGSLHERDGYLLLVTLRSAAEVIAVEDLEAPRGPRLDPRELRMAAQLIAAYEGEFRPQDYRDQYRERIEALIAAKAAGKAPKLHRVVTKKPAASLIGALEKSLAQAKRQPPRAGGPDG